MSRRVSESQKQVHKEWIMHLTKWNVSGLTQNKYCLDNDLNLRNFQYWKRKFNQKLESSTQKSPKIDSSVKIVQLPKEKILSQQFNLPHSSSHFKIHVGNIPIELNNDFSEEALIRLVKVLRSV